MEDELLPLKGVDSDDEQAISDAIKKLMRGKQVSVFLSDDRDEDDNCLIAVYGPDRDEVIAEME